MTGKETCATGALRATIVEYMTQKKKPSSKKSTTPRKKSAPKKKQLTVGDIVAEVRDDVAAFEAPTQQEVKEVVTAVKKTSLFKRIKKIFTFGR